MSVREIEFGDDFDLSITEQTTLDDHAGAVVWDASLVLAHALHLSATRATGESCPAGRRSQT